MSLTKNVPLRRVHTSRAVLQKTALLTCTASVLIEWNHDAQCFYIFAKVIEVELDFAVQFVP